MYNLIIGYTGPFETENEVIISASRFLEYTDSETQMRYRTLDSDAIRELKSFPCLFMQEGYDKGAFVTNITNIASAGKDYKLTFERDSSIDVIEPPDIERLDLELNIFNFEFYRTHWAVKNCDLLQVLKDNGVQFNSEEALEEEMPKNKLPVKGTNFNNSQIFIAHGHDVHATNDVEAYVKSKGLDPIVLERQASGGKN